MANVGNRRIDGSYCRNIIVGLMLTGLILPAWSSQSQLVPQAVVETRPKTQLKPVPKTIVYSAREIITLEPDRPVAQAVAVREGRIVGVGSRAEMLALAGDAPLVEDLRFMDKVIVPGLIEQHIHPVLSALALTSHVIAIEDWDIAGEVAPAAHDRKSYLTRLGEVEKGIANPTEALVSWGFHHYFHGKLTRQDLDAVSSVRPIFVWHRSAHEFILNSVALETAGINEKTVGGTSESVRAQIVLEEGHFWERGAFDFLLPKILRFLLPNLTPGLEMTERYLHRAGVTTAAEPGGMSGFYAPQIAVLADADTPLRFFFIPDGRTLTLKHSGKGLLAATEAVQKGAHGRTAFLSKQVKLFSDGAIYSQLMQMREGYLDGHHGEWLMDEEVFNTAFRTYWDAGYQIHVHQNGDAGLDRVLDVLRENMQRNPRSGHRTTIVHFGFSTRAQIAELASLGAIISANPYYPVALADKYSAFGIGPERADSMARLADVVKAGILLSLHSDMPMAPAQPLYLMWAAVNRTTFSGRTAGPEQALTPEQALRAVTIGAAYSLQLEDEIGSIKVGKRADLTILDENPLTVPTQRIKDIGIWGTVLGGRVFPLSHTKISAGSTPK